MKGQLLRSNHTYIILNASCEGICV